MREVISLVYLRRFNIQNFSYKLTDLDVSMLEWLVLLKPLYSWVSIPVVIVPAKEKRKTLVFTFERLKDDLSAIVYAVSVNSIDKIFDG